MAMATPQGKANVLHQPFTQTVLTAYLQFLMQCENSRFVLRIHLLQMKSISSMKLLQTRVNKTLR